MSVFLFSRTKRGCIAEAEALVVYNIARLRDPSDKKEQKKTILVPFSPSSIASRICLIQNSLFNFKFFLKKSVAKIRWRILWASERLMLSV